jgi:hypothetical protein
LRRILEKNITIELNEMDCKDGRWTEPVAYTGWHGWQNAMDPLVPSYTTGQNWLRIVQNAGL